MGDTWGISGPAFLALYIGLAIVGAAVAARPMSVRSTAAARPAALPLHLPTTVPAGPAVAQPLLHHYELACIAGGADRVATVAICDLITDGRLRIDSSGYLTVPTPDAAATDDATDDITDVVLGTARYRGPARRADIARALDQSPAMKSLRQRAIDDGYLVMVDLRPQRRRLVLVAVALVALGLARLMVGMSRHHPVELLVFAIAVITIASVKGCRALREEARVTIEGSALVIRYATAPADQIAPPMAVAASGSSALEDRAVANLLDLGKSVHFFGRVESLGMLGNWLDRVLAGVASSGHGGGGGGCGGGGCGGCGGCGG
jgi:uncharacterized protein (TIGR04222 family)